MHVGRSPLNPPWSQAMGQSNAIDVSLNQHLQDTAHLPVLLRTHHPLYLTEFDVIFKVYVEGEEPVVEVLGCAGEGTWGYHLGDDRVVVMELDDMLQENTQQVWTDIPTIFLYWFARRRPAFSLLPALLSTCIQAFRDWRLDDDAGLISSLKARWLALLEGMRGKGLDLRITSRLRLGELVIKREGAVVENSWVWSQEEAVLHP